VATVEITRYYTTVIETKILSGDITKIYVKMPVYTEKQYSAIKQKQIKVIKWDKTYGGGNGDWAKSIQQTEDGGYIVAGYTASKGAGGTDFWVIKLDEEGNIIWDKTYGGSEGNGATSIQQTKDGGYIVAGGTESKGAGYADFWVIKLNARGNKIWDKTYGESGDDVATSIQQTKDGGYIVAGSTQSKGAGNYDFWVIKLDTRGNKIWDKTYSGGYWDEANSIQQTEDGGYIVAGRAASKGAGGADFWVIKLAEEGNKIWDKTYGGNDWDYANSIQQTEDGGYIVAGYTASKGAGGTDFWVIKLDARGDIIWDKTYGGNNSDEAYSIQQTKDGGYIVAGKTESKGAGKEDFWVIKLDKEGNIIWDKTYGGSGDDWAYSIQQTKDGGYIVAGWTDSKGAGDKDFWVIKLDKNGELSK